MANRPMHRVLPARTLLLLLLAPTLAQANDAKTFREAAEHSARTLALVAADQGEEAARKLAGGRLPPALAGTLAKIARSKRTVDLRDLPSLKLKAALLPEVMADVPGAEEALLAYAGDSGARTARELGALEKRCRALVKSVKTLLTKAKGNQIRSRKTARNEPDGPLLLLFSAQAPLLQHYLEEVSPDRLATYQTLARIFDRPTDPWAEDLLTLLPRAAAANSSAAVGPQAELKKLERSSAQRLRAARASLSKTIKTAVEAATLLRDGELRAVLKGDRTPPFSEVVPLVKAYRKHFDEPPALRADPSGWGIYEDTRNRRLHFWLAGEGRWVRAQERVDDLGPVQEALLASNNAEVRQEATQPRTLAAVYGLFEAHSEASFEKGWGAFSGLARAASERVTQLREQAGQAGLEGPAFEARLGERLGVNARAFAGEREVLDRILLSAAWRGVGPTLELLASLERGAKAATRLPPCLATLTVTGAASSTPVDLEWVTGDETVWLTDLPRRLQGGQRVVLAGVGAGTARARGFAWEEKTLSGEATLAPGATVELTLSEGEPTLVADGERVRQLPLEGPLLRLVSGDDERPLRPAPGGGALALGPTDPAGAMTVRGQGPDGKAQIRTSVTIEAQRGVALGTPDAPVLWVAPGAKIEGRLLEAGKPMKGEGFAVRGAHGGLLELLTGETVEWIAKVPRGRYELGPRGDPTATPFGVSPSGPRFVASRTPLGPEVPALHSGEGAFLRLATWPTFFADEILEVRWTVGEVVAITRPRVDLPFEALLLPLEVARGAKSGERAVKAEILSARGRLTVEGSVPLGDPALEAEIELVGSDGPSDTLAAGAEALLVTKAPLQDARWTLLGPTGPARLLPRFDGQVPLVLDPQAPVGDYVVWVSGAEGDRRTFGKKRFRLYRAKSLELTPPSTARVGETVSVRVDAPTGFDPPFEVRADRDPWQAGTTLTLKVLPENDVWVTLRDGKGKQARGRLVFPGERALPIPTAKGPRFGIAANVKDRRIFAAPHDLLLQFKRSESLPPMLAIMELGPLTAAGVRDRIFQTVPYDGAAKPGDKQDVYQSERFWEKLQRSARERLDELEVTPGTPFTVRNSPSPGGEETLADLVGRHLDANGGWTFKLISVRVRADGASPAPIADDPKIRVRMQRASINKKGGPLGRVVVPGPLGTLELVSLLPEELHLDQTNRISFSLSSQRVRLAPRPYPADWHLFAENAFLVPELSVQAAFADRQLSAESRGLGKEVAGVDLILELFHEGPEREAQLAGQPRVAEKHTLRLEPLGLRTEVPRDYRFPALSPGSLSNVPEELIITVKGLQRRAVSQAGWPEGRPKPEPETIEGIPLYFESKDVPEASIELKIHYLRAAPGAKTPPPTAAAPLGDLLARGGAGKELPKLETSLAACAKALAAGEASEAEEAARAAIARAANDPRPWGLLADCAWSATRLGQARGRAHWALSLGGDERAWLVLAEAAVSEGELDAAREALEAAEKLKERDPALAARWETVSRTVK